MKTRRFLSLPALILVLAMLMTSVGFAAETAATNTDVTIMGAAPTDVITIDIADAIAYADPDVAATADSGLPVYAITEYGVAMTSNPGYIKTDWDTSGCRLDSQFLTGDYLLRRLRLTFDGAYNLYDLYNNLQDKNSISTVMATTTGNSKPLRDLLSTSTYRNCRGDDGIETLNNLKNYSEYRNNRQVRTIVDTALYNINTFYAPHLRESLAFFFPDGLMEHMTPQQLLQLGGLIINTPEYIAFHNSLYGHDCSTVRSLLNQGYSLDYVVRLYTNQAETAVKAIWPDYQDRMNDYWYQWRSW